jgi:hypothetical protein
MSIKISSGFLGLLTILFIGLKLTHNIDWPWLWVLSLLWIPAALGVVGIIGALIIALIALIFMKFFMVGFVKMAKRIEKEAEKNVTE